jgi:hypothetical protein
MYRRNPSGTSCAQKEIIPPSSPVLRPFSPYANRVRIQCEPTEVPASIEMFRSTTTNFMDAVRLVQGRSGESSIDDTNALPGITYFYWVRLQNAGGISAFSGPVAAAGVGVPVKWFSEIPNLAAAAPAISPEGTIYTCGANRLIALNEDGSTRWQRDGFNGSPMVGSERGVSRKYTQRSRKHLHCSYPCDVPVIRRFQGRQCQALPIRVREPREPTFSRAWSWHDGTRPQR